jgi:dTDP-glucose 4,6-dehydratase
MRDGFLMGSRDQKVLLVTGGAGFIGSNFVMEAIRRGHRVINLDSLTYAGNVENLATIESNPAYTFVHGSILDGALVSSLLATQQPDAIIHFAAESHVDRSIVGPAAFVETNITGTFTLLEAALNYWRSLPHEDRGAFRFLHVSTDEVYGSLDPDEPAFHEETPYRPNSPYSASKAASDHLVRAYFHTYQMPVLTTNCSNNYGPYQFPEKLIPLMIHNAIQGKALPVYGDGQNVRDWLYVGDHCDAILTVLEKGRLGETYNVGGLNEQKNLDVVNVLCAILDELRPEGAPHNRLITHVKDRPGHDRRYAIDCRKLQNELGWSPRESFATGIRKTVEWYLGHQIWVANIVSGEYRDWIAGNYGARK